MIFNYNLLNSWRTPTQYLLLAVLSQRRAKRVESERHVDLFAGLSLGDSDEEDEHPQITEDTILREGVGHLAPLLQDQAAAPTSTDQALPTSFSAQEKGKKRHGKTRSRQKAGKGKARKISPWADKCMYAELLEMRDVGSHTGGSMVSGILSADESVDGLPEDLEEGWVAVAPVPKGKRCLAVAHQGSGTVGLGECCIIASASYVYLKDPITSVPQYRIQLCVLVC